MDNDDMQRIAVFLDCLVALFFLVGAAVSIAMVVVATCSFYGG